MPYFLDLFRKLIDHIGQCMIFINSYLNHLDTFCFKLQFIQCFTDLAEAGVRKLAAFDKVTLIILSELAA